MDEAEKIAAKAAIEKARRMVSALCNGERRWTMSVPAEPDNDPDLVISAGLCAADQLLAAVEPASPQWRVPEGWKLVPIKLTDKMAIAGWKEIHEGTPANIWYAILAAAPSTPPVEVGR